MRNSRRHLSERPKFFCAYKGILRNPEIIECLLKFLMLVGLVQADRSELCQRSDESPLRFVEGLRLMVQNDERTEQPGVTDERNSPNTVTATATRFDNCGLQFRNRICAFKIEAAE